MKHELWSMIQAENRNRNGFQVQTNHGIDFVKRCGRHRYVIRVQGLLYIYKIKIF